MPFDRDMDYMEFRIQQGVEKNRKDFIKVKVLNQDGSPAIGAEVELKQLSHQFKFGANLFLLDEMESEEKNQIYRDTFPIVFNHATLPFYWRDLEPVIGKPRFAKDSAKVYRRPSPDLCLEYCESKGISPKAHCLVYDAFTPGWVPDDIQKSKWMHRKRLIELAERYDKRIVDWEVINETLIPYSVPRNHPIFLEPDYLEWAFDMAKTYFPANRLLINEATEFVWGGSFKFDRSGYYMLIERLLNKGVRIDGIGMQFHMFYPEKDKEQVSNVYYNAQRLYDVLDAYNRFRLPVQITEITIPAYSVQSGDEEYQAEIIKNLYRVWFSHEATESIVWWNLVDGYAYQDANRPDWNENIYYGGLLRHDLSKKPAWKVLDGLINKEWRTNARLTADYDGIVSVRSFYGDYEISAVAEGRQAVKKITLSNRDRIREYVITI